MKALSVWVRRMGDVAFGFAAGMLLAFGIRRRRRPLVITRRSIDRMYRAGMQ